MTALAPTADEQVRDALVPLTGVGLAEVVESASLLTRVDRKYVLTVPDAVAVLRALVADTPARVLEIDDARASAYESVYFDTPDLASYRMAATRRRRRFKVRTRTYVDSGTSFLEVKTRAARGTTLKQRVLHDDGPVALGAGREFVGRCLTAAQVDAQELDLAPGLTTRYHRTTLLLDRPAWAAGSVGPAGRGAARATIDTGLTWELDAADGARDRLAADHLVVVETKGGSAASGLDRLLWRHGHRPARISKYGTGLALLRPDLPDGPWRRVIRRHLTTLAPTGHPDDRSTRCASADH